METGTYLGQGSTRILIDAFEERPPDVFYTIEVSPRSYAQALKNLSDVPFVHCVWGLSVGLEQAERFIQSDPLLKETQNRPDIYIDSDDPIAFYLAEIRGALGGGQPLDSLPDRWLEFLLPVVRGRRPLIALDSAGGIGWLEFQEVMRLAGNDAFALFLDDVNHVKHYRSLRFVENDARFEVVASDLEQGWAVAVYTPRSSSAPSGGRR